MRLYLARAVRSVSIGARGPVHHQSIFCASGIALSAASPPILNVLRPLSDVIS